MRCSEFRANGVCLAAARPQPATLFGEKCPTIVTMQCKDMFQYTVLMLTGCLL